MKKPKRKVYRGTVDLSREALLAGWRFRFSWHRGKLRFRAEWAGTKQAKHELKGDD